MLAGRNSCRRRAHGRDGDDDFDLAGGNQRRIRSAAIPESVYLQQRGRAAPQIRRERRHSRTAGTALRHLPRSGRGGRGGPRGFFETLLQRRGDIHRQARRNDPCGGSLQDREHRRRSQIRRFDRRESRSGLLRMDSRHGQIRRGGSRVGCGSCAQIHGRRHGLLHPARRYDFAGMDVPRHAYVGQGGRDGKHADRGQGRRQIRLHLPLLPRPAGLYRRPADPRRYRDGRQGRRDYFQSRSGPSHRGIRQRRGAEIHVRREEIPDHGLRRAEKIHGLGRRRQLRPAHRHARRHFIHTYR